MLKQYVIVPKDPDMSRGKIASQVAHATYFALEKFKDKKLVKEWERTGCCVIVLECKDVTALLSADKYLDQWNIPHHLYIDEGHTEVDALTPTALATGIIKDDSQWMFEQFKLFTDADNGFVKRLLARK